MLFGLFGCKCPYYMFYWAFPVRRMICLFGFYDFASLQEGWRFMILFIFSPMGNGFLQTAVASQFIFWRHSFYWNVYAGYLGTGSLQRAGSRWKEICPLCLHLYMGIKSSISSIKELSVSPSKWKNIPGNQISW